MIYVYFLYTIIHTAYYVSLAVTSIQSRQFVHVYVCVRVDIYHMFLFCLFSSLWYNLLFDVFLCVCVCVCVIVVLRFC